MKKCDCGCMDYGHKPKTEENTESEDKEKPKQPAAKQCGKPEKNGEQ